MTRAWLTLVAVVALLAQKVAPVADTNLYGPQAWTAGTFSHPANDARNVVWAGDPNYPELFRADGVKTVNSAGPASERTLDVETSGGYAADGSESMLELVGIGDAGGYTIPSAGAAFAWDTRGNTTGVFYEVYSKFTVAPAFSAYLMRIGWRTATSTAPMFYVWADLAAGKLYFYDGGANDDFLTSATISVDNAWHHTLVQVIPSSDNGTAADGTINVWFDGVLVYTSTTSQIYALGGSPLPAFYANSAMVGMSGGLLPTTNFRIFIRSVTASTPPINKSDPCCGSPTGTSPTGTPHGTNPGALPPENPFQPLPQWITGCDGGGIVPSVDDRTDPESWASL